MARGQQHRQPRQFLAGAVRRKVRANRPIGPWRCSLHWHDRLQEPSTGFWGVNQAHNDTALLHAMAGSMHNYHLWYATGRP